MKNRASFLERSSTVATLAYCIFIGHAGCQTPAPQNNNNNNANNNGGNLSDEVFPFDVDIGRNGPLALNIDACESQTFNVTTGQGTVSAGAVSSETDSQPLIFITMRAPKNSNSTVSVADCGLVARFAIVPGDLGLAFATGAIRAEVRIEADQHGELADNYLTQITMDLGQISDVSPDLLGQDLGSSVLEYCSITTACTDLLPNERFFRGVDRTTFVLDNIGFQVGREYILSMSLTGSLTSVNGIPNLGGEVDVTVVIESLTLEFE